MTHGASRKTLALMANCVGVPGFCSPSSMRVKPSGALGGVVRRVPAVHAQAAVRWSACVSAEGLRPSQRACRCLACASSARSSSGAHSQSFFLFVSSRTLKVLADPETIFQLEPSEYRTLLTISAVPLAEHAMPAAWVSGLRLNRRAFGDLADSTYDAAIVSTFCAVWGGQNVVALLPPAAVADPTLITTTSGPVVFRRPQPQQSAVWSSAGGRSRGRAQRAL